jgi:hypothetical protein
VEGEVVPVSPSWDLAQETLKGKAGDDPRWRRPGVDPPCVRQEGTAVDPPRVWQEGAELDPLSVRQEGTEVDPPRVQRVGAEEESCTASLHLSLV